MSDLNFGNLKLVKHLGRIDKGQGRIRKELNLVQWYNNPNQYDLRIWDLENTPSPTKGISFSYSELETLLALLMDIVAEHNGKLRRASIDAKKLVQQGNSPAKNKQQPQPTSRKSKIPIVTKSKTATKQVYPPKIVVAPDANAIRPLTTKSNRKIATDVILPKPPCHNYTKRSVMICSYPSCNEKVYRDGFCKDHFSYERYTSK